ncbi:erythropoietin receptor [Gastrophryne carolinensis]
MAVHAPASRKIFYVGAVLLTLCLVPCRTTDEMTVLTPEFIHRVNNVIEDRNLLPFCFTVNLTDLTCFWESNTSDNSRFAFYYKPVVSCTLNVMEASNETWWHICQFPAEDVEFFSFDPYFISVIDRHTNTTLYSRELAPQNFVYTGPPTHFKVAEQKKPLGLLIFLMMPEKNPILKDCFMYQIKFTSAEDQKSMIFPKNKVPHSFTIKPDLRDFSEVDAQPGGVQDTPGYIPQHRWVQVNSENGSVKLFLDGVKSNADYTISVRVKADSPHDGYWSEWARTTFSTSNGFDDIHILLFVFAGIVLLLAIFLLFVYQGRFLKSKFWPDIPTPEHHFKELYTTHKGNFKMWLGQTDSYLTWISRNIFHEGPLTTLEVLSELPSAPQDLTPPVPLPPKDSYVVLNDNILPHFPAWMVSPRHSNAQSPAEVQEEQKTMRREEPQEAEERPHESGETGQPIIGEEMPTDGPKALSLNGLTDGRTILRGDSLNSEEGKRSPASSFEYTVLETCDGLLSPRTRSIPPRQPLKYAYLLMSSSGEESPPPSPVIYQNSPCESFQTAIYSQC